MPWITCNYARVFGIIFHAIIVSCFTNMFPLDDLVQKELPKGRKGYGMCNFWNKGRTSCGTLDCKSYRIVVCALLLIEF